jgi:hypothetical protein
MAMPDIEGQVSIKTAGEAAARLATNDLAPAICREPSSRFHLVK